jgi:glucosylglycerate synthase
MTTPNSIQSQVRQIEQVGTVDLVIGLVDQKGSENLATLVAAVRKGLEGLSVPTRTALVLRDADAAGSEVEGVAQQDDSLQLVSYSLPASDSSVTLLQTTYGAYRAVGEISQKLGARACAVLASPPESITAEWISGLVQPILEQAFDLVTPCYEPHRFEGLLNGAILSPLTCALYGKQLENPSGPDLGFSTLLFEKVFQVDSSRARAAGKRQFPQIGTEAIVKGLKVCQAHLGRRISPSVDWKNLDSVLAESLDPLFSGVERDAPFWQHIRSSDPVPTFGVPLPLAEESVAVDVRRLLEPFKLGVRNLQELWSLVLPPGALLELKKADRLPPEEFRIPDEVWARIVYDFALAYRLRTIARDHLLRAMTPLYLGWIASYAVEVESAAGRSRWERLCRAYESGKPYFVSRWRWPDRFNP